MSTFDKLTMETPASPESEEPTPARDLREELLKDLSTQFSGELDADGSLPVVAREALIELLNSMAHSSADIISAVSKNDPVEEAASDE